MPDPTHVCQPPYRAHDYSGNSLCADCALELHVQQFEDALGEWGAEELAGDELPTEAEARPW